MSKLDALYHKNHGDCTVDGCLEVPLQTYGDRMEIVVWKCIVCKKEQVAFYDLDRVFDNDKWTQKLLDNYLQDDCFRAFCVKHTRYERLRSAQIRKGQQDPLKALHKLYGMPFKEKMFDYAAKFMYRDELPCEEDVERMNELIAKNGRNVMVYNDPMRLPGFEGFAGKNILFPIFPPDSKKYYPLKNNFHALNKPMLRRCIDWYLREEYYEALPILHRRLELLPVDWPDYSTCIIDTYKERVAKRKLNEIRKWNEYQKYIAPYRDALEKPTPLISESGILPYPHRVKNVFYYYDWDDYSGKFTNKEEKYRVGQLGNYEVFKLAIKEARGKKLTYGHAHYLIRNSNDHEEHCRVILLLENGDTVVNVFYYLNPYRSVQPNCYMSIRKDHDVEIIGWGIRHLLQQLLPEHFKVDLRPGVCD